MEMELEIQTHNRLITHDMLEKNHISAGDTVDITGNAKLMYKEEIVCKSIGIPVVAKFILIFGSSVVAGIVGNYIWEKIKNETVKLSIDRKIIEVDKEQITKIIEEKIKVSK